MSDNREMEFIRRLEEFGFMVYTQYGKPVKAESTFNNRKCFEVKLYGFLEKDELESFKPYHLHLVEYAAKWASNTYFKVVVLNVNGKDIDADGMNFATIKYKIKKL